MGMALFIAIGSLIVMLLWNWLTPTLFGWPQITFWQALGLLALCRILFGGFRLGSGTHSRVRDRISDRVSERVADRMADRWQRMTPEERERFRQRMRERFGFEWTGGESKGD